MNAKEMSMTRIPKSSQLPAFANKYVRGLFSTIVSDSSFVRERRILVSHRKDEDDQENEKEDEREDAKQRVEGRVVENQGTHNMQMTYV